MHPATVVYLEHDGKVFLVNEQGLGPQIPVQGRTEALETLRFPTPDELQGMDIDFKEKDELKLRFSDQTIRVVKGYPLVDWPKDGAWKDA